MRLGMVPARGRELSIQLAALVPKPRTNLTRFHGVFAPNSKFRVRVTPAKRGSGRKRRQPAGENWLDKTPAERHASMTWMQRLKRVFIIDIEKFGLQGQCRTIPT